MQSRWLGEPALSVVVLDLLLEFLHDALYTSVSEEKYRRCLQELEENSKSHRQEVDLVEGIYSFLSGVEGLGGKSIRRFRLRLRLLFLNYHIDLCALTQQLFDAKEQLLEQWIRF